MRVQDESKRIKKAPAARGTRSQKAMAFRLDNDLAEWLEQQPNKGRYINRLIAEDKARSLGASAQ